MCNTEKCCNPAHLVGGTQTENIEDIFLHSVYDLAKEELARVEYSQHPYMGFFSEKAICNPPLEYTPQSNGLHIALPTVCNGVYPLPAIA
jgi:hypothetical protein